jgi:hypothetical protein
MDKRLVITYDHIDEGSRKELVQPSSISEFRGSRHGVSINFTTGIPKCRNHEMRNVNMLKRRNTKTPKNLFSEDFGVRDLEC